MAMRYRDIYKTIAEIVIGEAETPEQRQLQGLRTQLATEQEKLRVFDERTRRTRRPMEDRIARLTQQVNSLTKVVAAKSGQPTTTPSQSTETPTSASSPTP